MKIFAVHLYNDFSGSPKVLKQSVNAWIKENMDVTIVTCREREGFLSDIEEAEYIHFGYTLGGTKIQKLLNLIWSQVSLFFCLLWKVQKGDTVYINTVLPFGAALVGLLNRGRVVYHIHETSIRPIILKKFLFWMVNITADDVVYVSDFLAKQEKLGNINTHVIYNAIEDEFITMASSNPKTSFTFQNVLMVCSLKAYKGVNEFMDLAKILEGYHFKLVVNADQIEIDNFFVNQSLPENVTVFPTKTNLHPFYSWADVVLNLSRPDEWVETFGLTIIEAMAYGLPVIVPPVGGVTELVNPGENGFYASSRNLIEVSEKLTKILENEQLYNAMRAAALSKIEDYKEDAFAKKSMAILNSTQPALLLETKKLKIQINE